VTHQQKLQETFSQEESLLPIRLWRGGLALLAAVTLAGLALVGALALGWRTPTPQRPPDWTASDATWHTFGDGRLATSTTGLSLQLSDPHQSAWAIPGQQVSDFIVELDARSLFPSKDVGYGLLYRYQNEANYYVFAVGGDGYYTIAKIRKGTLTPLRDWQQWPHVRRGVTTNRLRVRCEGATCHFYVNGEFTAQVTDDALLSGDLGLWGQTFSDDALDVVFEEMKLWVSD
jgi:hypothetical protein